MGYYLGIFLEGPRKTVQNHSEDIGLPAKILTKLLPSIH